MSPTENIIAEPVAADQDSELVENDSLIEDDSLVEEVSIDGMCGVY